VPPQLWGWAGWRVKKMRRLIDHVLCTLEFEERWYRARGVPARYIGHPYFDELDEQQLNAAFVEEQQERSGTIIGLLPGSRDQEIESNLPALLAAATYIHKSRPDTRFLMACLRPAQRDRVKTSLRGSMLPMEMHAERTAEIIHLAHSCISVSGSVSLELLYRRKPSVMIYYANRFMNFLADGLMACRYFTLVNLLADRMLFPEYRGPRLDPSVIGGHVLHWLNASAEHQGLCGELGALREKVMKPGACQWAARYVLEELEKRELEQRRFAA
jgi:lipid-A-disaccharide synthase